MKIHCPSYGRGALFATYASCALVLVSRFAVVSGHGYLKSPRSRNFRANEDGKWWGGPPDGPKPESCPHCLNRKPASGTCGGTYDSPQDVSNRDMAWASQAVYASEQNIVVDVILTAHHKGHMEMKGCVADGGTAVTQACFDAHPLTFVRDLLYSAPRDPNYPERIYLAPNNGEAGGPSNPVVPPGGGMAFQSEYTLPAGLVGEKVLLQWLYVTGNTCEVEGYDDYPFPKNWRSKNLKQCGSLSLTGDGAPERFWNCAEVTIRSDGTESPVAAPSPGTESPVAAPTPPTPTASPVATVVGCCSYDYRTCALAGGCSTSRDHCERVCGETWLPDGAPVPPACAAKWTDCTSAPGSCCAPGRCGTDPMRPGMSACLPRGYEEPTPTAGPTGSPVAKPFVCKDLKKFKQDTKKVTCKWVKKKKIERCEITDKKGVFVAKIACVKTCKQCPKKTKVPNPSPTSAPTGSPIRSPVSCGGGGLAVDFGYYASWARGRSCDAVGPSNIVVGSRTHLSYSFAEINSNYKLVPTDGGETAYYAEFNALKTAHPGLRTSIAVGGWSFNNPGPTQKLFSEACATAANRDAFARSAASFLDEHGFDGIDLDWEYPGVADRGGTLADKENFVLLVARLREELGTDYDITMAVPVSEYFLQHYDLPGLAENLDFFNLMAYDLGWGTPGVHSHTPMLEVRAGVEIFLAAGVSPSKIVLGTAAYGRSYVLASVSCSDPGCAQTGPGAAGPCTQEAGFIGLSEIRAIVESGDYNRLEQDPVSESMFLVYDDRQWVAFDDATTTAIKTAYAADRCLRGTMVWAVDMVDGDGGGGQTDWCGTSWNDAATSCTGRCAADADCPGVERCYSDITSCESGGGTNWCGSSWKNASKKCTGQCPGGVDRECPNTDKCFADVTSC